MSTIDDLIGDGQTGRIRFYEYPGWTAAYPDEYADKIFLIRQYLAEAYANPEIRAQLFNRLTESDPLDIFIANGKNSAIRDERKIIIDPTMSYVFVDSTGALQSYDMDRVIVHEMIHAIEGSFDTTKGLSGSSARTTADYQGETVSRENEFYDIDRPSYSTLINSAEMPMIAARADLPGAQFDLVLLNSVDPDGSNEATSTGYNLITARNIGAGNVNDLLIAWNYADARNGGAHKPQRLCCWGWQ
ncbi:hypothetical protein [Neogemmobacter tilapiae]|uniref:Uncharacterized protein n=1 Tax=Neogemmobacter tilapiae TaxID=875041 RepID=A0A918TUM7_9RHOB|nr:hypothetical protein [Gemmobacter tilapiae]GHC59656.1 hypothetical protein GCM10007315_24280 [Gemmobacter tilapiae]